MELFSEIYSCYYSVVARILQSAPLTKAQIDILIREHAFYESSLYLMPKLCKEGAWRLLEEQQNHYYSILKNTSQMPITLLEKRWLKSLLFDPRIQLFLDSYDICTLSEKLSDVSPLYDKRYFHKFDIYNDGDDYENPLYQKQFKQILNALRKNQILELTYDSPQKKHFSTFECLPIRLEYSQKNDKFRAFCVIDIDYCMQPYHFTIVNLTRIKSIRETNKTCENPPDIAEFLCWKRSNEPITLTISSKRNGIERFMMEFASYEKQTEFDESLGICTASLWYDKTDETEILIKLLSFGPVITVTGPQNFLQLLKKRINKQFELLSSSKDNATHMPVSKETAPTKETKN